VSRSHDIASELQWSEYQREQWKQCADELCAAMLYFAGSRITEGPEYSREKNALRLYRSLNRAFAEEDDL
jgi:hypothetical protein